MHIYPKGQHGFALGNKITWFGFEGNIVKDFDLVSVLMNYAVNTEEVIPEPAFKPGDANEDDKIDVKDVIAIRRSITGGYGVEL